MLDTNMCIEVIRGRGRGRGAAVLRRLGRFEVGEIAISSITFAELCHGAAKSANPPRQNALLIDFCAPLEVAAFDARAAEAYGHVRATLERVGTPIGPLDTLIAAHALSLSVPVVTNNEREFRRVDSLHVENWLVV